MCNKIGHAHRDKGWYHEQPRQETQYNQYSADELAKDHKVVRQFISETDGITKKANISIVVGDFLVAKINEHASENQS